MDLVARTKILRKALPIEGRVILEDSSVEIVAHRFDATEEPNDISLLREQLQLSSFWEEGDSSIKENFHFNLYIFKPQGEAVYDKAILLLHGLNERTWDKYLVWAEYLAEKCNRPVILFPIAFHMDRTPNQWKQPRWIMPWLEKRKNQLVDVITSTYFNLTISSRLSQNPERFYISGKESCYNICQLADKINVGEFPFLEKGTHLDVFAYSIGSFLSQIIQISNPGGLFTTSKFFLFCGGSTFEKMNGVARDILDYDANETLRHYYLDDFEEATNSNIYKKDDLYYAFSTMIKKENQEAERVRFFEKVKERIKIITLKKDVVIPTNGAIEAVGTVNSDLVKEIDFPYDYTHQVPFPMTGKVDSSILFANFSKVFDEAVLFFA